MIEVKESSRARHVGVTVHEDGRVVVTRPRGVSDRAIERFVESRRAWIEAALGRFAARRKRLEKAGGRVEMPRMRRGTGAYIAAVAAARKLASERVKHFNTHYQQRYTSITIRNQKSRWGSASRRGTLSFNYRIVHLPSELLDYIIVHELCHLAEMNHSVHFWTRVAETIPDWKARRATLRRYRF